MGRRCLAANYHLPLDLQITFSNLPSDHLFKFTFRSPFSNLLSDLKFYLHIIWCQLKPATREMQESWVGAFFLWTLLLLALLDRLSHESPKTLSHHLVSCLCTVQLAGNKQTAAAAAVGNEESACFRRISLLASGHKYIHHNSVHLKRDVNRNHKSTKEM